MSDPIQSGAESFRPSTDSTQAAKEAGTNEDMTIPDAATLASLIVGADAATTATLESKSSIEPDTSFMGVDSRTTTVTTTTVDTDSSTGEDTSEETTTPPPANLSTQDEEDDEEDVLNLGSFYSTQSHIAKEMATTNLTQAETIKLVQGYTQDLSQEIKSNPLGLSKDTWAEASYHFRLADELASTLSGALDTQQDSNILNNIKMNVAAGYGAIFSELLENPDQMQELISQTVDPSVASLTTDTLDAVQNGKLSIPVGLKKDEFIAENATTTNDTSISANELAALLGLFAADQSDVLTKAAEYSSDTSENAVEIGNTTMQMSQAQLDQLKEDIAKYEQKENKSKKMGKITKAISISAQSAGAITMLGLGVATANPMLLMQGAMMAQGAVCTATGHDNALTKVVAKGFEAAGVPEKDSMLVASCSIAALTAVAGGGLNAASAGAGTSVAVTGGLGAAAGLTGGLSMTGGYGIMSNKIIGASGTDETSSKAQAISIGFETGGAVAGLGTGFGAGMAAQGTKAAATEASEVAEASDDLANAAAVGAQVRAPAAPVVAPQNAAQADAAAAEALEEAALNADEGQQALNVVNPQNVAQADAAGAEAAEEAAANVDEGAQALEDAQAANTIMEKIADTLGTDLATLSAIASGSMATAALLQTLLGIVQGATTVALGTYQKQLANAMEEMQLTTITLRQLQDMSNEITQLAANVTNDYSQFASTFSQSISNYSQTVSQGQAALSDILKGS